MDTTSENLEKTIEAILFWKNEPVSIEKLALMAGCNETEVEQSMQSIEKRLTFGVVLIRNANKVELRTSPDASEIIEKLQKEELSKELSKAALETLTIILYKSPVRRSEIDYIRGVNSQFIVRHLEARGLIEKVEDPKDARVNLYQPTFELFSFLGIKNEKELPEFDTLRTKAENFAAEILQENLDAIKQ